MCTMNAELWALHKVLFVMTKFLSPQGEFGAEILFMKNSAVLVKTEITIMTL